jgi:hypothetical protein
VLAAGLWRGRSIVVPWVLLGLGAAAAASFADGGDPARSPLFAAGLLAVGELSYWSLRLAQPSASGDRRPARVAPRSSPLIAIGVPRLGGADRRRRRACRGAGWRRSRARGGARAQPARCKDGSAQSAEGFRQTPPAAPSPPSPGVRPRSPCSSAVRLPRRWRLRSSLGIARAMSPAQQPFLAAEEASASSCSGAIEEDAGPLFGKRTGSVSPATGGFGQSTRCRLVHPARGRSVWRIRPASSSRLNSG